MKKIVVILAVVIMNGTLISCTDQFEEDAVVEIEQAEISENSDNDNSIEAYVEDGSKQAGGEEGDPPTPPEGGEEEEEDPNPPVDGEEEEEEEGESGNP